MTAMHPILPASYDVWRTNPPETMHRKPSVSTVRHALCIEGPPDVQIDAWGHYDADTGELVTVEFNGDSLSVAAVEKIIALMPGDFGSWADDLDEVILDRLVNEACADAEAERGDWLRDCAMDRD